MPFKQLAVGLLLAGPVLLAGSFFVPESRGRAWTDEQQQSLTNAEIEAHNLTAALDRAKKGTPAYAELERQKTEALAAVQVKYDLLKDARAAGGLAARIVFWCGVTACVAGLFCYGQSRVGP